MAVVKDLQLMFVLRVESVGERMFWLEADRGFSGEAIVVQGNLGRYLSTVMLILILGGGTYGRSSRRMFSGRACLVFLLQCTLDLIGRQVGFCQQRQQTKPCGVVTR